VIQAYTPAAKRQYGYFPLPILHRGALVGRLDAKAHRKEGFFEIKSVFIENDVPLTAAMAEDLAEAITRCAQWHKTPSVAIVECFPAEFLPLLRSALEIITALKNQDPG
jgi:hypothetical protein